MFNNYINYIFNIHPFPASISISEMKLILALIEKKCWVKNNKHVFIQFWVNNLIVPDLLTEKQLNSIEMIMNNNSMMWYHKIPILYSQDNIIDKESIKKICMMHSEMSLKEFKIYCSKEFNQI